MAEPVNRQSPTHSANSEALAGKPPHKRTAATATASDAPPPKRPATDVPNKAQSSSSDETKDTATTEPQNDDEIEEVEIPDDVVYQELDDHEFRYGTNPVEDINHMQRFWQPYIHIGVGDLGGWKAKIRHLENKFKNQSGESLPDYQMEEFSLWKKMFARVPPPDAGSRVS